MKPMMLLFALLLVRPSSASQGTAPLDPCAHGACEVDHSVGSVNIRLHNSRAQQILNRVLDDTSFWADASTSTYTKDKHLYDEIRLKKVDDGYVPMITGEGDEDFPAEVVADIVYRRNVDLPGVMSGADAVIRLGSGYDSTVGAEYFDSFYLLDFSLFYGHFTQRMYRRHDEANGRWIMWFEKLDSGFVSADTWSGYQSKIKSTFDNHDRRWLLNGYQEVTDVYGMFLVTKGQARESRVTFVSSLSFGDGSGFIARAGSKMPSVIRSGLKAGFDGCVAIAKDEKKKRLAGG